MCAVRTNVATINEFRLEQAGVKATVDEREVVVVVDPESFPGVCERLVHECGARSRSRRRRRGPSPDPSSRSTCRGGSDRRAASSEDHPLRGLQRLVRVAAQTVCHCQSVESGQGVGVVRAENLGSGLGG